jgi:hypothetical protein
MALPTSTIVMAVLTCIPFGLAIRDTVNGKVPAPRDDGDSDYAGDSDDYVAEYARAEALREAEEAETERLEQQEQERLRTARRDLFGAEVATLGSGFRGISLGMPESEMRSEAFTALEVATRVDIEPLANDKLDWIMIKPDRDASEDESSELCDKLGRDLQEAWGRGQTEDYERRYWVNPTTGTRAWLQPEECQLSFERFAEPKAWVTKTKTSIVPIWLVGQSIAKLREHIGTRAEFEDTESSVRWLGLGVGTGSGEARFEAFLAKGKVVAITAATSTFETTRDEVTELLTAMYGPPIDDDEGVHWKSRPVIQLTDHDGAGIALTIGKLPDDE